MVMSFFAIYIITKSQSSFTKRKKIRNRNFSCHAAISRNTVHIKLNNTLFLFSERTILDDHTNIANSFEMRREMDYLLLSPVDIVIFSISLNGKTNKININNKLIYNITFFELNHFIILKQ